MRTSARMNKVATVVMVSVLPVMTLAWLPWSPEQRYRLTCHGRRRNADEQNEERSIAKERESVEGGARAAARAARAALDVDRPKEVKREKSTARQRAAERRKKQGKDQIEEKESDLSSKNRRQAAIETEKQAAEIVDEEGLEARLRLRGVAAAESATAAAELAAAASAIENEALVDAAEYAPSSLDASEAAAAAVALNASNWPTAYLVGVEVTSRRGSARMAENRRRAGVKGSEAAVLEAASIDTEWSIHDSLEELAKLCETARLKVSGRTYQRLETPNGQTMVGKGKLVQVAAAVLEIKADAVVFDDELSLAQQRNILSELVDFGGVPPTTQILDRTQLVLQIFSERARTREAKTQVALARSEYMLPRLATFMTTGAGMELRGGSAGGGSGGGSGGAYLRGAGETQLEMDKRLFGKRIQRLRAELETIASKRQASRQRKLDQTQDTPLIALVGYTNAGKTSLLNALVEATAAARSSEQQQLYADDKLFATLDPTTRRITLPRGGRICKLTDTVGFLQKLPTRLIASFRATLEEINDADLLIHVVDASSDLAKSHVDAVNAIIAQLGAADIPQIRCLNKLDRCESELTTLEENEAYDQAALEIGARVIARTSATSGDGIQQLLEQIEDALSSMNEPITALVPFTEGYLLNMVYTKGTVIDLQHLESGTRLHARVPPALRAKLLEFAIED